MADPDHQSHTRTAEMTERHVSSLKVLEDGIFELSGHVYSKNHNVEARPKSIRLKLPSKSYLYFDIQRVRDASINIRSREEKVDRSDTGFTSRLDLRALVDAAPARLFDEAYTLEIQIEYMSANAHIASDTWEHFSSKASSGSVQVNRATYISQSLLVQAKWDRGVIFNLTRKAVVASHWWMKESKLVLFIHSEYFTPESLAIKTDDSVISEVKLEAQSPSSFRAEIEIRALMLPGESPAYLVLKEGSGRTRLLHYAPNNDPSIAPISNSQNLFLSRTQRSVLRIDVHNSVLVLKTVDRTSENILEVSGWWFGRKSEQQLQLRGAFSSIDIIITEHSESGFFKGYSLIPRVRIDLDFGHCIRSGKYQFLVVDERGTVVTAGKASAAYAKRSGQRFVAGLLGVELIMNPKDEALLEFTPPLATQELSLHGRRAARSASQSIQFDPGVVLFESFHGRSIEDNTLPVFEQLLEKKVSMRPYWTVADFSVEAPEGSRPVVVHSKEYYHILNKSQVHVTNNWLPAGTRHKDGRHILQMWHGTPLKRLGLDRFESDSAAQRKRMHFATTAWDGMVSQNPYSSDIFRRCYAFDGPVLELGYPRNDILADPPPNEELDSLRRRLGISPKSNILLYMPTWRENSKKMFSDLDLSVLQSRLGPSWTVLVRGHSMNTKHGSTSLPSGVIDVSLFSNPALLYLLADVFVTDYSSAMFDFSVTRKPMIFFVPDLSEYTRHLRGVYFDLNELAPGPLVNSVGELVDCVEDIAGVHLSFADRYRDWNSRFNPWDDGRATSRVVDVLIDEWRSM